MVLLSLLKLWLVQAQPLFAITNSDEVVYLLHARSLLNGEWMGSYNHLTLATGPFYPVFIALTFLSGLPLLFAEQLFYTAACLLMMIALLPLYRKTYQPLLLFAILLFNPVSFEISALRAIRDFFYASLTLMTVAAALGLLLRMENAHRRLWGWALALGACLGAFWLTREEGIWIFPALGLIFASAALKLWLSKASNWKSLLGVWGITLAVPVIITLLVSSLNLLNYGLFSKTEYDSKAFLSAYGSLTRLNIGKTIPYVPVTRKMRMNIYDISPAFSELRPYLEGEIGVGWAMNGAKTPENRGEIQGAWFMWALRDSVRAAGYYSKEKFPAGFYLRIAEEIDRACEQKWLDCRPKQAGMMPPWRRSYLKPLFKNTTESLLTLVGFKNLSFDCLHSVGTQAGALLFNDLTRERICGSNSQTQITGWLETSEADAGLSLQGALGGGRWTQLEGPGEGSPQTDDETTDAGAERLDFEIQASCPFGCALEIQFEGELLASYPFSLLTAGQLLAGDRYRLFIATNQTTPLYPAQMRLDAQRLGVLKAAARLYQAAGLILALFALAVYAFQTVEILKHRRGIDLWLVETSLLVAVLSRVLLIALIHTTSFEAIFPGYLGPAYPLWLTFAPLAALVGSDALVGDRKRQPVKSQEAE